jgi:hypothetical protein
MSWHSLLARYPMFSVRTKFFVCNERFTFSISDAHMSVNASTEQHFPLSGFRYIFSLSLHSRRRCPPAYLRNPTKVAHCMPAHWQRSSITCTRNYDIFIMFPPFIFLLSCACLTTKLMGQNKTINKTRELRNDTQHVNDWRESKIGFESPWLRLMDTH